MDIQKAARLCLTFAEGLNRAAFMADPKAQAAVLHQLMIIGEAVTRLSQQFQEAHPIAPWHQMTGMRNRLIHAYDDVDLEIVWLTVQRSVPMLLQAIEPFLPPSEA